MASLGKLLLIAGVFLAVIGLLLIAGDRLPFKIGRLPGDFVWKGKNSVFYFPLATSIVLSVVLTLVFWLMGRR
jgi:ribose/xylose/arabinose/galactoside ABC-type transport system permease subunit